MTLQQVNFKGDPQRLKMFSEGFPLEAWALKTSATFLQLSSKNEGCQRFYYSNDEIFSLNSECLPTRDFLLRKTSLSPLSKY
jgi:hypothetical protein